MLQTLFSLCIKSCYIRSRPRLVALLSWCPSIRVLILGSSWESILLLLKNESIPNTSGTILLPSLRLIYIHSSLFGDHPRFEEPHPTLQLLNQRPELRIRIASEFWDGANVDPVDLREIEKEWEATGIIGF